jgi:hypothetical protein
MSASFQSQSVRPFEMGGDHTLVIEASGMDGKGWLDLRVDEFRKLLNDHLL